MPEMTKMKLEYSFKRNFYSKLGIINKNGTPHVVQYGLP